MKKYILLLIIGIPVVFFVSGCGEKEKVSNLNSAKIIFTVGDVTVKKTAKWTDGIPDMELVKGSEIKTGPESQCDIVIGTDSFVTVKAKSHLILEELFKSIQGTEKNTLELKIGKSVINPKKLLKGDKFRVKTPTAIAAVRGTRFVVQSQPEGKLKIAVVSGKVELKRRIPALEKVEKDIIENSETLAALQEKVNEESIVVDANQSAFIDNKQAEAENKIIEEVVVKHVEEVKKEEEKKKELTETAEKVDEADVNNKIAQEELKKKEEAKIVKKQEKREESMKNALARLTLMKKKTKKVKEIVVTREIEAEDMKAVKELDIVIDKVKKEEARRKALKPDKVKFAELTINSPVKGSSIYVNSKLAGTDSVTIKPEAGSRIIVEVTAEGYGKFTKQLTLSEGESMEILAQLSEAASLTIASPVPNSRIYINSKYIGDDSVTVRPSAETALNIEVMADGFKNYTTNLALKPGESKELKVVLERKILLERVRWSQKVGSMVMVRPIHYKNLVITATHDGYLVAVNTRGYNVWKVNLKRRIESTPVPHNGNAYVVSNSGEFYSINLSNGRINWKKKVFGSLLFGAKPVIVSNKIFLATSYGRIYAFSIKGKELWFKDIENGIYSSPAYKNGMLFVGAEDHNIYALSVKDGSVKWKFKLDNRIVASSPVVKGTTLYIGSYSGTLFALDTGSGSLNWKYKTGDSIFSSPVISNNKLLFGSNDGKLYVLSSGSGKLLWVFNSGSKITTRPAVTGNMVYITSGKSIFALNIHSGKTQWSHRFKYGVKTSATVVGNDIYIGLENGEVASVRKSLRYIY
ncbi:MAG: PQQ-binding-like beta-propeller repeat protein [bacterium]|nr:PQQ-binding-like beta-propeller repeat protein [bacterium]